MDVHQFPRLLSHPSQKVIDLTEDSEPGEQQTHTHHELAFPNKTGFTASLVNRAIPSAVPRKRSAESSEVTSDDASIRTSSSRKRSQPLQPKTPQLTPQPDGVSVVIPSPPARAQQQLQESKESERSAFSGLSQKYYPVDYFEKAAAKRAYPVSRVVDRAAVPLSRGPAQAVLSSKSPGISTLPSVADSIHDMIQDKLERIRRPPVSIAPMSTNLLARLAANFDFINDYKFQDGVEVTPPGFIGGCDCSPACFPSIPCGCLNMEENSDDPIVPYELAAPGSSLFVLTEDFLRRNSSIRECNHNCACSDTGRCWNKVVQRGRTVRLEIFDTGPRGFGLRSSDYIQRGQYVDRYLGEIITRKEADLREASTQGGQSYLFSLDWWIDDHTIYVVDGQKFGSATRFINHSCNPNCKLVPVANIHGDNQRLYDLAFFARRDIPPGTELTFDYNPGWKASHKKIDPDAVKCLCGSKKCRGQLWPNRRKGTK